MDENDQPRDKRGRFSQKKISKDQNIRLYPDEYNLIEILRSSSFVSEKMRAILNSLGELFTQDTPETIFFYSGITNKSFNLFLENFWKEEGLSVHHLNLSSQIGPSRNKDKIRMGNMNFLIWSPGGQLQFKRALWETKNVKGFFFVLDLNEKALIPENRINLARVLKLSSQKNIPFVILPAVDASFQSENNFSYPESFGTPSNTRCQIFPFTLVDHLSFTKSFYTAYQWMTSGPLLKFPFHPQRLLPSLLLTPSKSRKTVDLESVKDEHQLTRFELESLLIQLFQIYLQIEE